MRQIKALFIEAEAAKYIAQERTLQTGEFDDAIRLSSFIRDGEDCKILNLSCKFDSNIAYVYYSKKINLNSWILFDMSKVEPMLAEDDNSLITILQKIVKFAVKHWNNFPLTHSEKIIDGDTAILFPFPYVDKDPFRIKLNLSPKSTFTDKRNIKCITVDDLGYGVLDGNSETTKSALKKIMERASHVCIIEKSAPIESNRLLPVCVEVLDSDQIDKNRDFLSYADWDKFLSSTQRKFISMPLHGTERLEGAAGTGKTIALILRAIYLLEEAKKKKESLKILFLCHSIASLDKIKSQISSCIPDSGYLEGSEYSAQSITVTTLQQWSLEYLGNMMGRTEVIDEDAQECKDLQQRFIAEKYDLALSNDYPTYRHICSDEFNKYIDNTPREQIIESLISEISVSIKGRAGGELEVYEKLPRLEGSMPLKKHGDFIFVFLVYQKYQDDLSTLGYFDNDDIAISASLQLRTPIWQRRRKDLGYDVVIVDETHLFSFNEMNIFHQLSKDNANQHIIYAIDKAQAVGDRGQNDETITKNLGVKEDTSTKFQTIFRSTPQIIDLAFSVLSHGVSVFRNFENPLDRVMVFQNDGLSPRYILTPTDDEILEATINEIDFLCNNMRIRKSQILIITTTLELQEKFKKAFRRRNKPCTVLTRRGDYESIRSAYKQNHYILGYIDYIGGLEFDSVIIVGADKGRIPCINPNDSALFQEYEWHNRLYVAITRARTSVSLIGSKERGYSPLLAPAIENNLITIES